MLSHRLVRIAVVLLLAAVGSSSAGAAVITGNLYEVLDGGGNRIGSTVDHIYFSVLTAGTITIDTLSWEADSEGIVTPDGVPEPVDVNGDGEIAFFDPYIYLFYDDGSLDVGDLIESNDDSGSTYSDGSIYAFDSYISPSLAVGDYVLAIGAYFLDSASAVAGFNPNSTFYPVTCSSPIGTCDFSPIDHGDYRVTFTGDVTVVPEPTTAALLTLGLTGLVVRRRIAAAS